MNSQANPEIDFTPKNKPNPQINLQNTTQQRLEKTNAEYNFTRRGNGGQYGMSDNKISKNNQLDLDAEDTPVNKMSSSKSG